ISKSLKNQVYFTTLMVKGGHHIFDSSQKCEILIEAFQYYQVRRSLKIYAYVIMRNHLHLIAEADDMIAFVRDFKKITSTRFKEYIKTNEPNTLKIFINDKNKFQFWKRGNMPKLVWTEKYFRQKKEYIENNPVRKGYVEHP
ncbi:MAG: transposase, partial [Acidobacteria bacterium]|nr:transposase [Acidobacteriota bacterium]